HVGKAHHVTHFLQCATLKLETLAEVLADVTRRTTEAEHRVFFMRLVQLAANQIGVLVRLEVGQAHNHLFRMESRGQGGNTFNQLLDVEIHRAGVAGNALLDDLLHITRNAVEMQQRFRVHADHAVDDELEACQAHALIGQRGEVKGTVRVADVHHDLERQLRHRLDRVALDIEIQAAVVNLAGITFSTGYGYFLAIGQLFGGITTTNDRWHAQLAGDNGGVTGTAATVGDN